MIDNHAFGVEMVSPDDDDSTLNNMTTSLGQICGTQLLETSIEVVRNNKKTMVSKIDSVINLMKEVEYEEQVAEQTKKEATQSHSLNMLKVYELMHMQQHIKKKNDTLAREAYEQKNLLSTKMDALQLHVAGLLDKGDRSLELLDEMIRSLEMRLTSAMMKKKLAIKKKKGNEECARAALAYEQIQMEKVEEESKRLKQEAVEISKLQEFLIDRGHLVTMLHGEISDKCQDVKLLKAELDQSVLPGGESPFSRKSSISADSDVPFKNGSGCRIGDFIDDDVLSANHKQIQNITRSIKQVKMKGKLSASQMFAKSIKKVKIKGKPHEYQMFAKSIKKLKIKRKLHGNAMISKSIKKVKIKCKVHGSKICVRSFNKLKMKGKRHGSQVCAKSTKNLKIQSKRRGSQMCSISIKKVKINSKLHGKQPCPKSIKKVKIKGKQQGGQMCASVINKDGSCRSEITEAKYDDFSRCLL